MLIRYIVVLEHGVWLAKWDGDAGRTEKIENAKVFTSVQKAEAAIQQARRYRPFRDAFVELLPAKSEVGE